MIAHTEFAFVRGDAQIRASPRLRSFLPSGLVTEL